MFVPANYKVKIGDNDFPVIGEIGYGERDGKRYSLIVREIRSMEWVKEDDGSTALLVRVIVEINDKDVIKQLDKKNNEKPRNKFTVIEGGK